MKIEKINDRQIRCTLSRDDLVDRELRISELAYGSEKAKALFRDMMQQANYEFGFEAEDIPLMIEAIPVSSECLVLVITKVEDPDELDTRFSKFSPVSEEEGYEEDLDDSLEDDLLTLDQITDLLNETNHTKQDLGIQEEIPSPTPIEKVQQTEIPDDKSVTYQTNLVKVYTFSSLNDVIKLASIIYTYYKGMNTLYKNQKNNTYFLVIAKSDHSPEEFNKICNIISEYGKPERSTYASPSYYQEHYEVIVKDTAIQILSVM